MLVCISEPYIYTILKYKFFAKNGYKEMVLKIYSPYKNGIFAFNPIKITLQQ